MHSLLSCNCIFFDKANIGSNAHHGLGNDGMYLLLVGSYYNTFARSINNK